MSGTEPAAILLTGASGFVGQRIAPRLAAAAPPGARLVALCRGMAPDGWTAATADIADADAIADLIAHERPRVVVHLAAQSSIGAAVGAGAATWQVNALGAFALARACALHAPEAVVLFASSGEVYGDSFLAGPVDEDAPPRPKNSYARSKVAAEGMFADILAPTNRLLIARAFNHTGAGQDTRFVLPSFAQQIAAIEAGNQPPVMQVGNLDAARDFLDVEDVCDAYLALLANTDRLPAQAIFNVASGRAYRIGDLLLRLRDLSGTRFEITIDPTRLRPSEIPTAVGRNDRLAEATGWAAKRSIDALLSELLGAARRRQTLALPTSPQ